MNRIILIAILQAIVSFPYRAVAFALGSLASILGILFIAHYVAVEVLLPIVGPLPAAVFYVIILIGGLMFSNHVIDRLLQVVRAQV